MAATCIMEPARKLASTHRSTTRGGPSFAPSSKAKQHMLAVEDGAVPPAYTSQDCSGCGERVEQSLSVRTHICPSCGLILDRDENAAKNIQWAGQALAGSRGVGAVLNREASPACMWGSVNVSANGCAEPLARSAS